MLILANANIFAAKILLVRFILELSGVLLTDGLFKASTISELELIYCFHNTLRLCTIQ